MKKETNKETKKVEKKKQRRHKQTNKRKKEHIDNISIAYRITYMYVYSENVYDIIYLHM